MARLTEKEFWDARWGQATSDRAAEAPRRSRWRSIISDYNHYLLLHVLLARMLPPDPKREFLEIGSAPGEMLVEVRQLLGGTPYGVEYSEIGADMNRRTFARHGIPTENVIHSDFFAEEFQTRFARRFDFAFSRGFIEHFSSAELDNLIDRHTALVKDGGYLLVSIPNFTGFRGLMTRVFNKSLIAVHNLEIMRLEKFRQLFERADLEPIFCDYIGVPDLEMPSNGRNAMMRIIQRARHYAQVMLSIVCYAVFGDKVVRHSFFSPQLLFVGKVRPAAKS